MTPRLWYVVPAAGAARRMGGDTPKQYLSCRGRTLLEWSLAPFVTDPRFAGGVVALAADDAGWRELPEALRARVATTTGGRERADSVLAGLAALPAADDDWVLVHDAARPCLPREDLERLVDVCRTDTVGGLLALPVVDTLKRADGTRVAATVPREGLWRALTPQMFRAGLLRRALREAAAAGAAPGDEATAVERLGERPLLVEGSALNVKVTRPSDLALVSACLALMGEDA
jgi:2-C-methyl-D-erythritol 4-phosphate cytidylyltransferase